VKGVWLPVLALVLAASVPFTAGQLQQLVLYTFLFISLSVAWNIIGGYGYRPVLLPMERCVEAACAGGKIGAGAY